MSRCKAFIKLQNLCSTVHASYHSSKLQFDIEKNPGPRRSRSEVSKASNLKKARTSLQPQVKRHYPFTVIRCWQASFHQGHVGNADTAGRQCACNATVALSTLPTKLNYSHKDLNEILFEGDKLYSEVFFSIPPHRRDIDGFLSFGELPPKIKIFENNYNISKLTPLYPNYNVEILEENIANYSTATPLALAIEKIFEETNTLLVMGGQIAFAMYQSVGKYYVFDSHSRTPEGKSASEGTAVLLEFNSELDIINYLKKFMTRVLTTVDSALELQGVKITSDASVSNTMSSSSTIRNINAYFQKSISNQRLKDKIACSQSTSTSKSNSETATCSQSKKEYMQTYRKTNPDKRAHEEKKDNEAHTNRHEDSRVRAEEQKGDTVPHAMKQKKVLPQRSSSTLKEKETSATSTLEDAAWTAVNPKNHNRKGNKKQKNSYVNFDEHSSNSDTNLTRKALYMREYRKRNQAEEKKKKCHVPCRAPQKS